MKVEFVHHDLQRNYFVFNVRGDTVEMVFIGKKCSQEGMLPLQRNLNVVTFMNL